MQIFARTLQGETIVLEVEAWNYAWTIKRQIVWKTGCSPLRQRLVRKFGDQSCFVADSPSIGGDYGITPEDTLILLNPLPLCAFPVPLYPLPAPSAKRSIVASTLGKVFEKFKPSKPVERDEVLMLYPDEAKERQESLAKCIETKEGKFIILERDDKGFLIGAKIPRKSGNGFDLAFIHLAINLDPSFPVLRILTPIHHPLLFCPLETDRFESNEAKEKEDDQALPPPWGSVLMEPEEFNYGCSAKAPPGSPPPTTFSLKDDAGQLDQLHQWLTEGPRSWPDPASLNPDHYAPNLQPWIRYWNTDREQRERQHEAMLLVYVHGQWEPGINYVCTTAFKKVAKSFMLVLHRLMKSGLPIELVTLILARVSRYYHNNNNNSSKGVCPFDLPPVDIEQVLEERKKDKEKAGKLASAQRQWTKEHRDELCLDMDEID